jgi:hypothetical protein
VGVQHREGICHPYDVSLLAPSCAALVGAAVGLAFENRRLAPPAWGRRSGGRRGHRARRGAHQRDRSGLDDPVLIGTPALAVIVVGLTRSAGVRAVAVAALVAVLLVAPASWAVDTLGHVTSGTVPTGTPATTGMTAGRSGRGGTGGRRQRLGRHVSPRGLDTWGHIRCDVIEP